MLRLLFLVFFLSVDPGKRKRDKPLPNSVNPWTRSVRPRIENIPPQNLTETDPLVVFVHGFGLQNFVSGSGSTNWARTSKEI